MGPLLRSLARHEDAGRLADLRVAAMQPSLEAVGRFDPARARSRFLDRFVPEETTCLHIGSELVGLYVLRRRDDHLYLDHLYFTDACQGQGLGREVVATLQSEARKAGLPIRLMALRGSPANGFYLSCGFTRAGEDEFDIHYEWVP